MKHLSILLLIFCWGVIFGQNAPQPVKWNFTIEATDDQDHYKVSAIASIEDDWNVYSSKIAEGGPIGTSLSFAEDIRVVGDIIEPLPAIEEEDSLFDMTLIKFKKKAIFERIIETDGQTNTVQGEVRFMTCDGQRCLPPTTIPFTLKI